MPLAFLSKSHGPVAFGFFNIETDLLLLGPDFFFAQDFCALAVRLARTSAGESVLEEMPGWIVKDPQDIGDLHSSIAGFSHQGLIGAVYRHFPFPRDPEAFKQNPDGYRTRERILPLLETWAVPAGIPVRREASGPVQIGEFEFDAREFRRLVKYVHEGGYPRWKGGIGPPYTRVLDDHYYFGNQRQT